MNTLTLFSLSCREDWLYLKKGSKQLLEGKRENQFWLSLKRKVNLKNKCSLWVPNPKRTQERSLSQLLPEISSPHSEQFKQTRLKSIYRSKFSQWTMKRTFALNCSFERRLVSTNALNPRIIKWKVKG